MHRLTALLQVLLLLSLAAGCAGGAGLPGSADEPLAKPEFAIPTPADLLALMDQPRRPSYVEGDLVRLGKDYDIGFPSGEVLVSGDSVAFNAAWIPGQGLTGLAFCIYSFTIPGFDRAPEIHTTWSVNPGDTDSIFFGLSNWDSGHWDWFAADTAAPLVLPSFDPYRDASDDMLLVVAVIDSGTPVLDKVQLGPPPSVDEWLHSWGGGNDDFFVSTATNHEDYLYVAGTTGSYGEGGSDALVVGYGLDGGWTWGQAWGGPDEDSFSEVAVGEGGEVYTTGTTYSAGQGAGDVLIVGWSADGVHSFTRTWGSEAAEEGHAMALSAQHLYILASTVQETSGKDLLLLKFDTGMAHQVLWGRYFGGAFDDTPAAIVVTQPEPGIDQIHVAFELGVGGGDTDAAYCMLDASGNVLQQQRWDNATYDLNVTDLALTGAPGSQVFLCGSAATDELGTDMFLLEYAAAPGYLARAWRVDPAGTTRADALAVDQSGNLVLAGFASDIDVALCGLQARISPVGQLQSAEAVVGSGDVRLSEMVISPGIGTFVAGRMPQADGSSWQSATLTQRDLSGSWTGTALASDLFSGMQGTGSPGVVTLITEATVDAGGGAVDGLVGLKSGS